MYIDSESGGLQSVLIGGDVTVTGDKSRGVYLGAEEAVLSVEGSVTVTGGVSGVSAGKGEVAIKGDITAPDYAVNAWHGASVTVQGNVVATEKEATAVSSSGADVHIQGNVTSSGQDGMGIYVSAWKLVDPAEGAKVTVDGKISAATPLRMESLPVEESEHTETTTKEDYYTFTDGTNTVWAKPGSFQRVVTGSSGGGRGTSAPVETPKTETNVAGNTATAATTVTVAVDSSGNATAIVNYTQVSDAISKAREEAEKQGEGMVARVEIKVEAPAAATTAETSIPKEAVSQAAEAGIGALTISTPVARRDNRETVVRLHGYREHCFLSKRSHDASGGNRNHQRKRRQALPNEYNDPGRNGTGPL
ncbi:MAG: hypothetical protein PHO01_11440 [Desulfotomaculaceae bacterium]|nr:hypothetical protein [Desulfotomaculaceae bacterium]